MDFREFLKTRRTTLKISQAQLADELSARGQETSSARVGHWETGRNNPPLENPHFREALASVLQMDVNDLMAELGFIVADNQRSKEALLAAQIIDHLPPLARDLAIDYLKLLEKRFINGVAD